MPPQQTSPTAQHLKDADLVPQLTSDCVILGFHDNQLRVLLLRWKNTPYWSLPGGPVRQSESVDAAANRILQERTGLDDIFLQQFHVFGEEVRYSREDIQEKLKQVVDPAIWYKRAISIGYYALVDYSRVTPAPDAYTDECRWWDIREIPPLLFDHNNMIEVALESLRRQLSWQPIGYNLLRDPFTLPELQRLYETILGRNLDPRNFQRKMLRLGILERQEARRRGGAFRSPYLYIFIKDKYEAVLKEGGLLFV